MRATLAEIQRGGQNLARWRVPRLSILCIPKYKAYYGKHLLSEGWFIYYVNYSFQQISFLLGVFHLKIKY